MPGETTLTAENPSDAPIEAAVVETPTLEPAPVAAVAAGPQETVYEKALRILEGGEKTPDGTGATALDDEEEINPLDPGAMDVDSPFNVVTEDPLETEVAAAEAVVDAPVVEEAQPVVESAAAAEEEGRKRLNINRRKGDGTYVESAPVRAILRLAGDEGISFAEAAKQLGYDSAAILGGDSAAQAEAQPVVAAEPAKTSKDLATEIEAKLAELEQAGDELQPTGKLFRELRVLESEESAAKAREAQQAQAAEAAQQSRGKAEVESMKLASDLYPSVIKPGALRTEYEEYLADLKDADSAMLRDPEWALATAAMFAARKGIAPAKLSAAQPANAARAAQPSATSSLVKNSAPAKRATPVPSPGGMSGGVAAADPTVGILEKLRVAKARGDASEIDRLQDQYRAHKAKAAAA